MGYKLTFVTQYAGAGSSLHTLGGILCAFCECKENHTHGKITVGQQEHTGFL